MSIFLTILTLVGLAVIPYLVGNLLGLLTDDKTIIGTWVFGFIMCLFISAILIFLVRGLVEINNYYESIL